MLYVLREGRVAAYHDDNQEAAVLAAPDYAGAVVRKIDAAYGLGDLVPDDASGTILRDPGAAPVVVVAKLDFYRRCSDPEAEAIDQAFAGQPTRMRRIFDAAQTFRSDAEEWPLLQGAAIQLFGEARAAELLAPTE
jgi:hypothetical protein